jgi:hypothetical protein
MGVCSSCCESLETSLRSVSAARASARCASADCLVCRDADIFRGQIVTRIQISYQCSLFSFIQLSYNERNYVHYTLTMYIYIYIYIYIVFLFVTVVCYLTELYCVVVALRFIFCLSACMHECVCVCACSVLVLLLIV